MALETYRVNLPKIDEFMASSATSSSLSNLITRFISFPISFGTSIVLAKVLGPDLRGTLSYLLLFHSFSMPILNLGLGTGVTFFISKKDYSVDSTYFTSLTIALFQGLFGSLLLFIFWKNSFLVTEEFIGNFNELFPLLILLPLNAILFYTERTLIGKSEFIFINYMTLLQPILYLSSISLVYFFGEINVLSVMYCILFYNLIRTLLSVYRVLKQIKVEVKWNKSFVKKISGYGVKGWFGRLALAFNLRIDQFFLGSINSYFLGIYVIAVQLAEIIWIIPDSLGPVLFNQISVEKDENKQLLLVEKIHRILFGLVLFLAIVAGVIGFVFIPVVFGEEYAGSVIPFVFILPGIVMQTSVKILTKIFAGRGKIEYNSMVTLFGMGVSVLLYYFLIPKYGVLGAAIGSSIGYSASSLFAYLIAVERFKFNLTQFFIPRKSDLTWVKSKVLKKSV